MTFKVAIVGRPNVGKSTLFNRLVGKRLALVHDEPGVTRDRREGEARLGDLDFTIIDTAGLEEAPEAALESRMREQTERAIAEADVSLFLIDARAGVTPMDRHFSELLRKGGRPVVLAANKAEGRAGEDAFYEAFELGLGEPLALSAEHGEGMGELYAALEPFAAAKDGGEAEEFDWDDPRKPLRIAIVGRPNAGKSTLVNRLIGEDRMLTGPEAGITRDSISVEWRWHDGKRDWPIKLHDTAGLRKKSKVTEKLEKLSVSDALRAVQFAEVVILMTDAETPFEKQDLQIADLVLREGRALILAVNKWDLIEEKSAAFNALKEKVARLLPQAPGIPVIAISAETGSNLDKLLKAATGVYVDWNARVKTPDLNNWLADAVQKHPPPAVSGRRLKIRYAAQTKTRPPTFVAMCSRADEVPESYRRYLLNSLREAFDIPAVPVRLLLRKSKNPYAPKV
ncbi:MAG: ribosome biogenesis GTPase Der [Pseudomonadota bacterium]